MASAVFRHPAVSSQEMIQHAEQLMRYETDCWDVHHALSNGRCDFVLLDVRGEAQFREGHIEGAVHLPHTQINADSLSLFSDDSLFVVYCAGPHCNGADKAALRLAKHDRPVKKMIGGVCGWLDEGFSLATGGICS